MLVTETLSTFMLEDLELDADGPISGWVFPANGQRTAAWQLRIRAVTRTISTGFVVA